MDDLIKIDNEIEKRDTEILYDKVLDIKSSTLNIDFKGIINQICQYTNIIDVVDKVKKGTQFVVQIPTEFQAGFDSGDFWIMENSKTGKMWPNLMELGDNGKNKIVTPLSVKKEEFIQGNPARDVANNFHNIYMQQQMNELIGMVETTYKAVERIEHGQMDDRIALLEAGRQGIILALSQKDEESRKQAMLLAVNNINVAQNQIFETLKRRINEFEPLPKTKAIQFLRELMKTGYLENRDNEYNEIIDYYGLYLEATKMLAGTYAIVGDVENTKKVFELSTSKLSSIDFKNLKSIEYVHKNESIEKIYENSSEYLSTEENNCLEDLKEYDCLSITLTKEELLEVFENGTEKEISREKIE